MRRIGPVSEAGLGAPGVLPVLELSQHLGARAALVVDGPSPEAVLPLDFIGGDDELEVPGGVGGLQLGVAAAAAGRMGETEARAAFEHHHQRVLPEQAVEERLLETERREVLVERLSQIRSKGEIEAVIPGNDGAAVVVPGRAELL